MVRWKAEVMLSVRLWVRYLVMSAFFGVEVLICQRGVEARSRRWMV